MIKPVIANIIDRSVGTIYSQREKLHSLTSASSLVVDCESVIIPEFKQHIAKLSKRCSSEEYDILNKVILGESLIFSAAVVTKTILEILGIVMMFHENQFFRLNFNHLLFGSFFCSDSLT